MKKFVKEYKYQFQLFCNKIIFRESKLKRHKKNHNKVTFLCTICWKSYYRADYFRKHEQNCQNFDISFSINKNNDFIPRFTESCFYANGNDIVSNNPLEQEQWSFFSFWQDWKWCVRQFSCWIRGRYIKWKMWARLKRIDRSSLIDQRYTSYIEKFNIAWKINSFTKK